MMDCYCDKTKSIMKRLPGLVEDLKNSAYVHLLHLEEHNLLEFPKGFEIHRDSVGGET